MPPTLISPDLFNSMAGPLSALSPFRQNTPKSPSKSSFKTDYANNEMTNASTTNSVVPEVVNLADEEFHDTFSHATNTPQSTFDAQDGMVIVKSLAEKSSPPKSTHLGHDSTSAIPEDLEAGTVVVKSPSKRMSPVKTTLFDNVEADAGAAGVEDGTVLVRSPIKRISPIKKSLFDDPSATENHDATVRASPRKRQASKEELPIEQEREHSCSPTTSPRLAMRFNEGLTISMQQMQLETKQEEESSLQRNAEDELMSRIYSRNHLPATPPAAEDEIDLAYNIDEKTYSDLTIGDLSTISAIQADMTRFANLRKSPTKTPRSEAWSPSKQLRNSVVMNTPGTAQHGSQRPLHLLSASRHSNSSNEDEEATPRRPQSMFNDSPTDLLNFTGQSNIHIPPPGSAPRSSRRTPSGRGAFPVRVNPSPTHRSQASVDRQAAAGNISPQKSTFPHAEAPPASSRKAQHGLDLLDIDLEPMATPRSIPSVTPRELESLRSELQSRISGLEATLSGKEAEVSALKRAITDAEVRVGKTSEELRNERAGKEDLEHKAAELERRSREMEDVLREVKQNAFVEEHEREKLRREKEEIERKCEEKDVKVLELTASLDTLRDQRIQSTPSPRKSHNHSPSKDHNVPQTPGGGIDIDTVVKNATENVARELHALYKGKHERKVADLKTSYEKRWQKQVQDLRDQLKASQDEVLALQTSHDATMSGVVPNAAQAAKLQELSKENDALAAAKGILDAKVAGLEEQVVAVRVEAGSLRKELEQERVEKGELVAQVDLFLSISAEAEAAKKIPLPESPPQPLSRQESQDGAKGYAVGSPDKSTSRTSLNGGGGGGGIGAPPKLARPMSMLKAPTKYSALPQLGGNRTPARAVPGRAGILENIARMGAGGR